MLGKALTWENQWVDSNGIVTGTTSPNFDWLTGAFGLSYNILANPYYSVVARRIDAND
jgi:hypothetical protein